MILYFTDKMNIGTMLWIFFLQIFPQLTKICSISSKRYSNVIHFILKTEFYNIILIVCPDSW